MYKIKLFSIGKTKESWLEAGCHEYLKRLQPTCTIETKWAKNNDQLIQWVKQEPFIVSLDPRGQEMSSEVFSSFLLKMLEEKGSRLSFVIGGAEGLPLELKEKGADLALFSLSQMTFTHQMARLLLLEQLYRAFEIARGSSYHK